jgi:hypothetical protein
MFPWRHIIYAAVSDKVSEVAELSGNENRLLDNSIV